VKISVEVAYAGPEGQWLLPVQIEQGASVAEAIRASGIEALVPAIAVGGMKVGIFSRVATPETPLANGDRVEIYRGLVADPKEARRQRAARDRKLR